MRFLKKYMLFILLLANMTSEYRLLAPISEVFFYSILALSVIVILLNLSNLSSSLRSLPEIKSLIAVYLVAQFVFQLDLLSQENVLYTVTKVFVFLIIALSVYSNYNFYLEKVPIIFSYLITILILLGWFVNRTGEYYSLMLGFNNRNVACTIATAGFAGFLFMDKKKWFDNICMLFLFITIIYGGSRNAFAMCLFIIAVRYGFSFKVLSAGILVLLLLTFILPEAGIETTAFDRVVGTIDGSVSTDREIVRETAWNMIALRPWTGWGYHYYIPVTVGLGMNAHNGYITMIENLGYPCGLVALSLIIFGSIKLLKLYKLKNRYVNYYIAIVISTMFAAYQEDYFIGVNQFTTNYFFVAFVILCMFRYYKPHLQKIAE